MWKKTEPQARDAFVESTKFTVIETGLIISKLNTWLGYSPDGIIIKNLKPTALLEFKCTYPDRKCSLKETLTKVDYLVQEK